MIRSTMLLCMWCGMCLWLSAQTTIFSDNFNNGCTSLCLANGYNGWTVASTGTNGSLANTWYVSCAENGNAPGLCGSGCGNDASLHVGNAPGSPGGLCPSGDCGAAYDASTSSVITNQRVQSPTINCSGYGTIMLNYDYIAAQATGTTDTYFIVYSPDDGITWLNLGQGPASLCCCSAFDCFFGCCPPATTVCGSLRQGQWGATGISLPASAANNPFVRIGFEWTNNGDNIGTDPSVAIDDISVSGMVVFDAGPDYFTGERLENDAALSWGFDEPPFGLEIQKSDDGDRFFTVKTIDAGHSGRSATGNWSETLEPGENPYYRLQTKDQNGRTAISRTIYLAAQSKDVFDLFPNPLQSGQLNLHTFLKSSQPVIICIYDLSGKLIWDTTHEFPLGQSNFVLAHPKMPAGLYAVEIQAMSERIIKKVWFK